MSFKSRNFFIFLAAAAVLFMAAGLNVLLDPFDSFEARQQGRFEHSARIPILMYHHFSDEGSPEVTISAEAFENQIKALSAAGYTTITFKELRDYVNEGTPLPGRPVLITIDDGYMSVYDTAFPILQKYGMKATVFIIGVFFGKDLYKDNPYWRTIPHFGEAETMEMTASGVISIQSHSWNMHQYEPYEDEYREGALRMKGESRKAYIEALTADFGFAAAQIENVTGNRPFVYSYPFGKSTGLSESVLRSLGVEVTLTTVNGVSVIIKGAPRSLFGLKRLNVPGDMAAEELLKMIGRA